ncbi:MAG: type II toxin-antitoxin system death-on-curing family toxin [Sphingobacteriales bacterium]|jgi:death-on-curing protein|nr:type II toxin-antitoxin system death-on-curing family toxin [Sphingobacteriales bacterium]
MITLQDVLIIHEKLIEEFGGSTGVRDINLLESALARPFSGFGDVEFYPTPAQKAAALVESVVVNHPFIDGNKRTGYVLMRLMLMLYGKDINATQTEKYDFVIKIASGIISLTAITDWIEEKIV